MLSLFRNEKVENIDKFTQKLHSCSYRDLQQITKLYDLPSNFKKDHLIEMIVATRMGQDDKVKSLIQNLKKYRYKKRKGKSGPKKRQTLSKDLQISLRVSPPITVTPKRTSARASLKTRVLSKYNTRSSLTKLILDESLKSLVLEKPLRSYQNIRTLQGEPSTVAGEQVHKVKLTSQCIQKCQVIEDNIQVVCTNIATQTIAPVKRQRTVSGIYPISFDPVVKLQRTDLTMRNKDGTVIKLNAFVQEKAQKSTDDIIKEVLNDLEANNADNNAIMNMSTDSAYNEASTSLEIHTNVNYVIYENHVEETEYETTYKDGSLPRIEDVFSQFNTYQLCDKPILLQVTAQSRVYPNYSSPYISSKDSFNSSIQLEKIYNFQNESALIEETQTHCTFSTAPLMSSKVNPSSTAISPNAYASEVIKGSYETDQEVSSICIEPSLPPYNCPDYINRSIEEYNDAGSFDTNSIVAANITIPEMIDDALEVISQDEDYIRCVDVEAKRNCILCDWTGPGIIIEFHVQKTHTNEVISQSTSAWNITFTLLALLREPFWCSRIIEYQAVLYVLSVRYEEPDELMAVLTSLSADLIFKTAAITVFNQINGEPFSWEGAIKCLPTDWPYSKDLDCLKVNLSKLDLVSDNNLSDEKLNDIHVILFVRLG